MVCLAGSTWAWFTASIQTTPQMITAASYDIGVTIDGEPISSPITLATGENKITLTASGTATEFGGYCVIARKGADPLYTCQLLPGDSIPFTLVPSTEAVYTFTPVWGVYSGKADITDGCTINQGATDDGAKTRGDPEMTDPQSDASDIITYTVQSGDTLGKITQDYGTTAEKLAAYNGIEDPDYMQAGWTLKIPPEDYEIPASSTTSEESDESAQQTTEPGESVEKEPAEQAGSATENLPADDPSADTDSANDPSAGTDSANDPSADTDPEETTEESGSESSEPTDGELLEPDPDKTDETMESQPTEAPAE